MNRFHFSWLIGLVLATTAGCDRTVGVGSMDGQSCTPGETRQADCNGCSCTEDGTWSCTTLLCSTCTPGQSKLADDGCNQCSCGTDGTWACTEMACLGTGGTTGAGGATSVGGAGGSAGTCTALCPGMPACNEGDTYLNGPVPCPSGATCYSNTLCCSTVWCMKATAQCEAMPVCDAGDTEITGTCPPDGSCYERTLCGTTINCRRNTVPPCPIGAVRQSDVDCNNLTCKASGWSTTLVYCPLSCTPGSTKPSTDGCNTCTCNADGNWACTQMACIDCLPGQMKVCEDGCNTSFCGSDYKWGGCTEMACTGNACATGKANYAVSRANLLLQYKSVGCTTDADCTIVTEYNECNSTCGTAVPASAASTFSSNLTSVAGANCASCAAPVRLQCGAGLTVACESGTCVTKVESGT